MPSPFLTLKERVRLTCFDAIPQWDLITYFTLTEHDGPPGASDRKFTVRFCYGDRTHNNKGFGVQKFASQNVACKALWCGSEQGDQKP